MSAIVKRRGAWSVVVEQGSAPARHCAGVALANGKVRRHRVWTDDHDGELCPTCGQALGPITQERRRHWHGPYKTKTEAKAAERRLGVQVDNGLYRAPSDVTLREFIERTWLPQATYRPSTLVGYRSLLATHIVPGLGGVQLRSLSTSAVSAFYVRLRTEGRVQRKGRRRDGTGPTERSGGLSERTISGVHKLLHRVLEDAVDEGLIARNPASRAKKPKPERAEMHCWTTTELRAFVEFSPDDRLAGLWHLIATTGMRRGEVCGLRWSDVDLDAARLSVSNTIVSAGYRTVSGPPKTDRSIRVLALDGATVAALRRHRTRQAQERLAIGEAWTDTGLVFTREDGTGLHPQTVTYEFQKRAEAAGLPRIRLHDVRHSYATAGLSLGEHPKVMQERLGHSNVSITLDIYSHVTEGIARESSDRIAAHILGG